VVMVPGGGGGGAAACVSRALSDKLTATRNAPVPGRLYPRGSGQWWKSGWNCGRTEADPEGLVEARSGVYRGKASGEGL